MVHPERFFRAATVACLLAAPLLLCPAGGVRAQAPPHPQAESGEIGGIGRIVPAGGILVVGGPPGATIAAIHVRTGDKVKRGDLLLTLDSGSAKAEEAAAGRELQALTKLAQEQLAVQALGIRLAEERVRRAEKEFAAYKALGANSVSEKEAARLQAGIAEAQIAWEIEQRKLQQVRAEIERATQAGASALETAKAKSAAAEIRAPSDGTILEIRRHAGERMTGEPALEMADLATMDVICQVYEGDLLKIAPGVKATIKNSALPKPLTGKVAQIGRMIDGKARLGDVTIRLDDASLASRLVSMEVEVVIAR